MRRFVWLRLLISGLCAGLVPACTSTGPGPSPYVRSGKPLTAETVRPSSVALNTAPRVRPAVPYDPPRPTAFVTNAEWPALTTGASASGLPLVPYDDMLIAERPPQILLAGYAERATKRALDGAPRKLPKDLIEEPPMMAALRCYMEKRPEDAPKELAKLDAATREILLTLMPLTVRVGEGGLAKADPREIALVVDQLQGLLWTLRPKAALVMDKCSFCRQIRRFGVFESLEGHPTFQPGEMVEIYAEVRNVASQPFRSKRGDYRTHLCSSLHIRKPNGESAWSAPQPFDKPDDTMTPQHDYFQHYRLPVPQLAPGPYVLHLEVTDVPTGRKVARQLEFTIGPSGGPAQSE